MQGDAFQTQWAGLHVLGGYVTKKICKGLQQHDLLRVTTSEFSKRTGYFQRFMPSKIFELGSKKGFFKLKER